MCESNVYDVDQNLIMEDVLNIKIQGKEVFIEDILGDKKEFVGEIVEIDLDKHSIIIKLE